MMLVRSSNATAPASGMAARSSGPQWRSSRAPPSTASSMGMLERCAAAATEPSSISQARSHGRSPAQRQPSSAAQSSATGTRMSGITSATDHGAVVKMPSAAQSATWKPGLGRPASSHTRCEVMRPCASTTPQSVTCQWKGRMKGP